MLKVGIMALPLQDDVCHFYHGYKKERDWEILNYSYTSENF